MTIIRDSNRRSWRRTAFASQAAVLVGWVLFAACATTVSEEELNRICANRRCTGGPIQVEPDAGASAGNDTGGGGSVGIAGSSNNNGGSVSTGGSQGGGGSDGDGGETDGGSGGGGSGGTAGGAGGNAGGGAAGAAGGGAAGASGGGAGGASGGGAGGNGGTAGNGGSGGAGVCPAKTSWTATASSFCTTGCSDPNGPYPPSNAVDGSATTRFSSGQPMAGTEWLQIDFGAGVNASLDGIALTTAASNADDFGRQYAVRMSNTNNDMASAIIVQGAGMTGTTTLNFPATANGRYLLITQTTAYAASWWSVHDITIDCH